MQSFGKEWQIKIKNKLAVTLSKEFVLFCFALFLFVRTEDVARAQTEVLKLFQIIFCWRREAQFLTTFGSN